MKIDVFNHVLPQRFIEAGGRTVDPNMAKRTGAIPTLWDMDARLKLLDAFDDVQQVISLAGPPIEVSAGPERSPELTRIANDEMAAICEAHRDRFPSFLASLPMNNPDEAVKELDRAIDQLGAAAVQIFSNVKGVPLDDPRFLPVFERAVAKDVALFLHPTRGSNFPDYQTETKSRWELWWAFGWPHETSVAMARMVLSGLFDRLPGLKVVTHHMGAMIPYFEGRITPGMDVIGERSAEEAPPDLKRPIIDYFKGFYADTALFGAAAATRCGLEFFGADQCLFASDCPFDPEGGARFLRDTIRILDGLDIAPSEREKIYTTNARKMLKLK